MSRFTIGLIVAASLPSPLISQRQHGVPLMIAIRTLQDPLHQQAIFRQSAGL